MNTLWRFRMLNGELIAQRKNEPKRKLGEWKINLNSFQFGEWNINPTATNPSGHAVVGVNDSAFGISFISHDTVIVYGNKLHVSVQSLYSSHQHPIIHSIGPPSTQRRLSVWNAFNNQIEWIEYPGDFRPKWNSRLFVRFMFSW